MMAETLDGGRLLLEDEHCVVGCSANRGSSGAEMLDDECPFSG